MRRQLHPAVLEGSAHWFRQEMQGLVVGQVAAIDAACRAHIRGTGRMKEPNRPVSIQMYLGPSSVGKTWVGRCMAKIWHGSIENCVFVNCAEYWEGHSISRLLGAPPGYLGAQVPGSQLPGIEPKLSRKYMEGTRKNPKYPIVVILDEIEKAHEALYNVLLAVFRDGKAELGNNLVTRFDDCAIILTSNIGQKQLKKKQTSIGFGGGGAAAKLEKIKLELERHFAPEFLKRIDEFVQFFDLSRDELAQIVELGITYVQARLEQPFGVEGRPVLNVSRAAKDLILELSIAEGGTAADVNEVIRRTLQDPCNVELGKEDSIVAGSVIDVDVEDGNIVYFATDPDTPIVHVPARVSETPTALTVPAISSTQRVARAEIKLSFIVSTSIDEADLEHTLQAFNEAVGKVKGVESLAEKMFPPEGGGKTRLMWKVKATPEQIYAFRNALPGQFDIDVPKWSLPGKQG